jgi:hypothetical protein
VRYTQDIRYMVFSLLLSATDGLGESSEVSRPLKEGEVAEWILLDGVRSSLTIDHIA